jgi:oxidoreductase AflX
MPTYALLGATGSTGSAILRCLLLQPPEDLTFRIFVRSRSKLLKAFPDIESTTAFKAKIIEGTPSDATATEACLKDVDVVMACIGSNYSTEGMSLIYDTATAIVDALEFHRKRQGSAYKTPTIIQLRSASLNPILKAAMPWVAQKAATFCFYYIYEDLDRACKLFASSSSSCAVAGSPRLLDYIYVDPPAIHDADGTTPTGHKLIIDEHQDPALSYSDLGAAFCEVATRREEFAGKAVGVTATGKVNLTVGTLVGYVATGVKGRLWG